MRPNDPNLASVELVAAALGPLVDELVLVGGCAAGLLLTDDARPANRETKDVDLVAEVASVGSYYGLASKIKERGFTESQDHICRWVKGDLIVDVLPTADVLGSSTNRWYVQVVATPSSIQLSTGTKIRIVSARLFVATKLDAFHGRGEGDYSHHDIEDIVNLVDGRAELVEEILAEEDEVKAFIQEEFDDLLATPAFTEKLVWHLNPDQASQARLPLVLERMRKIAGL